MKSYKYNSNNNCFYVEYMCLYFPQYYDPKLSSYIITGERIFSPPDCCKSHDWQLSVRIKWWRKSR